jgi:drug/metabolite transporter (DMT)-like permease
VRAFVRDEVDARRRLVGLFLPVLGAVVISAFGPASDLQRYLLFGSLAALVAVLADAVLMAVTITRAARAVFPGEPIPLLATGWYAFLRAHRSRSVRRPAPRVSPGDVPDLRAR